MHPEMERLHLYLNGALSPADRRAVEDHLAVCGDCGQALAALIAEDEALSRALELDTAEMDWIGSVDLVAPVMAQIAARHHDAPLVVPVALLIGLASNLGGTLWRTLVSVLPAPDVGTFVSLVRTTGPSLVRLVRWLANGGLLAVLWPGLVVGAAIGFWYVLTKGEKRHYA